MFTAPITVCSDDVSIDVDGKIVVAMTFLPVARSRDQISDRFASIVAADTPCVTSFPPPSTTTQRATDVDADGT